MAPAETQSFKLPGALCDFGVLAQAETCRHSLCVGFQQHSRLPRDTFVASIMVLISTTSHPLLLHTHHVGWWLIYGSLCSLYELTEFSVFHISFYIQTGHRDIIWTCCRVLLLLSVAPNALFISSVLPIQLSLGPFPLKDFGWKFNIIPYLLYICLPGSFLFVGFSRAVSCSLGYFGFVMAILIFQNNNTTVYMTCCFST